MHWREIFGTPQVSGKSNMIRSMAQCLFHFQGSLARHIWHSLKCYFNHNFKVFSARKDSALELVKWSVWTHCVVSGAVQFVLDLRSSKHVWHQATNQNLKLYIFIWYVFLLIFNGVIQHWYSDSPKKFPTHPKTYCWNWFVQKIAPQMTPAIALSFVCTVCFMRHIRNDYRCSINTY